MTALDEERQSLVVLAAQVADGPTHVADRAADLLAAGESMSGLGRLFGISRQSAAERFGITVPRDVVGAARRIESWHGRLVRGSSVGGLVRVSVWRRFVVFDDGHGWRILRHAPTPGEAEAFAQTLGNAKVADRRVSRYVKRPADFTEDVARWALGPYALLAPEREA